ncbi:3518_t:CDS:2, partial [Rhizophagus irregularis]
EDKTIDTNTQPEATFFSDKLTLNSHKAHFARTTPTGHQYPSTPEPDPLKSIKDGCRFLVSGYAGIGGKEFVMQKYYLRLFLDNWMRRTSNVELARIPYNDGRRHGPYESHHLLRHQGIKKTIGYASTLAVVLIKIHVGRKLKSGDTKGVSLEFGKWFYGGGKKLPGFVRR